jgi:D-hexose-6-phosphate mutarotase
MTPDIPERLKRFEVPGRITLLEGNGELPKVELTSDWSTAEVYLLGAHVSDFRKRGESPLLFTSQCSRFAAGQPIRGGVPIIFPWFGAKESSPAHGFARTVEWELHEASTVPDGGVSLRFGFPGCAESAMWPPFAANYVVTLTDVLTLELILTNSSGDQPLDIETCLHTYFSVADISAVRVAGLKGLAYLDKVEQFAQKREDSDEVALQAGSNSTVLWNPWVAKSQQMADFGNDEYKQMLCVESGNVAKNKLRLGPGKSSVLKVELSSSPL